MSNIENSSNPVYNATLFPQGSNKPNAIQDNSEVTINITGATSVELFVPVRSRFSHNNLGFLLGISAGQKMGVAKNSDVIQDFTIEVISILYNSDRGVFSFNGNIINSSRWTDGFTRNNRFNCIIFEGSQASAGGTITGISDAVGDSGGVSLQGGVNGTDVTTRRLVAGTDVSVTDTGTGIQVASTLDKTEFVSAINPDDKAGNLTMTAPAKVIQSEAPVNGDDLTNKTYVDSKAPTAPPTLDAFSFEPKFPKSIGPQGLDVCDAFDLVVDKSYNELETIGQWFGGCYLLESNNLPTYPQGSNPIRDGAFIPPITKGIIRYRTPSGQIVYGYWTSTASMIFWGVNDNTTSEIAPRPFGNDTVALKLYGQIESIGVLTATFAEPLPNTELRLELKDFDSGETLRVPLSNALAWSNYGSTAPAVLRPDGNDLLIQGAGTGTNVCNVFLVATTGSRNEIVFEKSGGAGLYIPLRMTQTNIYTRNFLVRTQIENAVTPSNQIFYVISTNTNVFFYDTSAPTTAINTWTQDRVEANAIFATVDLDAQEFTLAYSLYDARLDINSTTVTRTFAVIGDYCRPTASTSNAVNNRLPSTTSTESYRYGTTAIPATGTLVLTNTGVLVPASALVVAGITANELRVSTTTLGGASSQRFLLGFPAGTKLNFRKHRNSSSDGDDGAVFMQTNGVIVDNGTYFSIPIQFASAVFPGVPFDNIVPVTLDLNVPVILEDLQNVQLTAPVAREVLMYQSGGQWTNTTPAISDLIDVDDVGRADTDILTWFNSLSRWGVTARTLANQTDVTFTSLATGDQIYKTATNWVNWKPVDGQIKANSFNTNLTSNAVLTFTGLTTEVDVVYRITGETTTAINLSSAPTTSIPLNYNGVFQALGTVGVDGDFYRLGATAADDRWIQNPVLGQISEYRIEGSYSNKTASNSGRIQIRIYNPLSAFSFEAAVPLAQGTTADDFGITLITISDAANLLPTGGGYKIGISSTTSVDVIINSIVRIDRPFSKRS